MSRPSALVGQPPATDEDYWIVRGLDLLVATLLEIKQPGSSAALPPIQPEMGALIPPPRPPPELYRFETRGPQYVAGAVVGIVIALLITGVRLAIRIRNVKLYFGADDCFIILGVVSKYPRKRTVKEMLICLQLLAVVDFSLTLALHSYAGAGKHIYDCTYHEVYMYYMVGCILHLHTDITDQHLQIGITQIVFFYLASAVVKMSIVFFYMRLSGLASKGWRIAHWTLIVILALFCVAAILGQVFQCRPAGVSWNLIRMGHLPSPPKCYDESTFIMGLNIIHILTDFALLVAPIVMLWKVQMKVSIKLRIWIVGVVGVTSCVFSVIRTISQFRSNTTDPTCKPSIVSCSHTTLISSQGTSSKPPPSPQSNSPPPSSLPPSPS